MMKTHIIKSSFIFFVSLLFCPLFSFGQNIYNYPEISRIEVFDNKKCFLFSSSDLPLILSPNFGYVKIDFDTSVFKHSQINYSLFSHKRLLQNSSLKSNYVILSHLKPGNYRFSYSSKDGDGIFHEKNFYLLVKQSRFGSKSAILIYIGLFIPLTVFAFRFQTRAFRKITRQFRERDRLAAQLMKQKEELTLKNKNITDSIIYAKRIQNALMPPEKLMKKLFPESFILHISKDIVSGDFYWINETKDSIFLAAADCTGHGVPGAFMSIIGFELFRKITNIQGIKRPSEILKSLNNDFKTIFKDIDDISFKDGMDVAFCSVDKQKWTLEFSGAFNPLYIIRDNSIIEVKGDRSPIGLLSPENPVNDFTNHAIQLQNNDVFYIFSDGFADQFGGPEGKKYKYRRFRHLLLTIHQLPMIKQYEYLHKSIMDWKGDLDQVDDILVIGVRVHF